MRFRKNWSMETGHPLAIDLFCGLGGWAGGFLAEGYEVIGFDIEAHDYWTGGYPGQLVLQDVLTLHGSQFNDATCIVASPPCQEYSYMAMPWKRARKIAEEYRSGVRDVKKLTALLDACFRIQREACEAAGRHIPLVVENVKGAQPWVGRAKWHYGSYYLWGDVPALMPFTSAMKMGRAPKAANGVTRRITNPAEWQPEDVREYGSKNAGSGTWFGIGSPGQTQTMGNPVNGTKHGGDWFSDPKSPSRKSWGTSNARKAASAMIAKIPLPLAQHIAKVYKEQPCQPRER